MSGTYLSSCLVAIFHHLAINYRMYNIQTVHLFLMCRLLYMLQNHNCRAAKYNLRRFKRKLRDC